MLAAARCRAALRRSPLSGGVRCLRATLALREGPPKTDAEVVASLMDKQLPHHKLEEELDDAECASLQRKRRQPCAAASATVSWVDRARAARALSSWALGLCAQASREAAACLL
eukprot:7119135-Prymnesium_polylepis.2